MVGLKPRTSRSGVRHSTTEPPRSPDQTGQMPRLIRVFTGGTCHFVVLWLISWLLISARATLFLLHKGDVETKVTAPVEEGHISSMCHSKSGNAMQRSIHFPVNRLAKTSNWPLISVLLRFTYVHEVTSIITFDCHDICSGLQH